MKNFKFYKEWNGNTYLELHCNHTLWKINKPFNFENYEFEVLNAIFTMKNHFKDLEVLQLGRSGRHICVLDTPTNRKRYKSLVQYAEQLEQNIIDYFNKEDDKHE